MKLDEKILARFDDLIAMGTALLPAQSSGDTFTKPEPTAQWGTSSLSIISRAMGTGSDHYRKFDLHCAKFPQRYHTLQALGVLKSARDDFAHGMLFDTRIVIEAEVFADFLEQANHLLQQKYEGPAAVIAGAVIEDGLRKLCDRNSVQLQPNATLAPMNDALAKQGAYTKLVHDKLMPVIRLRNHAAHGEWDQFTKDDVRGMIDDVRDFMAQHFS